MDEQLDILKAFLFTKGYKLSEVGGMYSLLRETDTWGPKMTREELAKFAYDLANDRLDAIFFEDEPTQRWKRN